MRAWHLLLAVLATLQTIVQVASTEDNTISSRFIQAIQPIKKDIITFVQDNPTTTAIKPPNTAVIQKPPMTTALMDFHGDQQTIVYKTHKKSDSDNSSDKQQHHKQKHIKQQQVQNIENPYQNIASENLNNKNNIIDITNFEEIETNDLNEEVIKKFDKTEERAVVEEKYQENLTEDKTSLKYSKQQHKTNNNNKMALSVNTKQQQQEQQTNEQQINQKVNTEDAAATAATTQISSSLQQQPHQHNHHQQQQQTQPASQSHQQQQHQQQQQQHHHHHHHHHHNQQHQQHHHQQHTQQQHQSTQQTSDNLSSPITTTTTTTPTQSPSITTTPMDVDVVAEDVEPQVDAVIPEDGPRTYSNKEIIGDKVKPDPSTLVEIENSLLSLFKMKRPPKIDRSKIIIPEAMKQLYAQIMGHELNSVNIPKPGLLTKSANTVRSFTHQDSKIDDRFPHHHRFRLYFDTKSIPAEEKLKAAELQLTRDAISHASLNPRLATRIRYQVLVYDITRVGVRGKREPSYLLLDNKTIRLNSTETVSLDVQPAVDRWLASPNKNFGLLVEVRTSRSLKPAPHPHVRLRRSADEEHEAWQHKQPLLFTYTDDGSHKSRSIRDVSNRSKRAGGGHHRRSHRRKNSEEICHRHSLYVDFADVGWSDWIVAPPGYDAFYCQGKCPFPLAEHLNSTNHAVVQTIVNNVSPEKVPRACCVPTQLEGISMLYLNDQSTVVLKNYQDMTVVGCGCR